MERQERETGLVLGDFRLLKKLGAGAMGVVYKARQISSGRARAVKVLYTRLASNPKAVERFYREGRAMAQLDHPNLVRGYEVGEVEGRHFLVEALDRLWIACEPGKEHLD